MVAAVASKRCRAPGIVKVMMRTPNFVAALKMAGAKSLVEPLKRASAGLT